MPNCSQTAHIITKMKPTPGLTIQNTGTVNLTGGAFTLPQTSTNNNGVEAAGILNIASGGTLNISGGTHVFNERSSISGTFRVSGSAATINMHQMGSTGATFDFIFDSGGVSTITGAGGFPWFSIDNSPGYCEQFRVCRHRFVHPL